MVNCFILCDDVRKQSFIVDIKLEKQVTHHKELIYVTNVINFKKMDINNLDTEIDIENDLGGVFMDSISYIAEHYKQFLFIVTFLNVVSSIVNTRELSKFVDNIMNSTFKESPGGQIKCSFTRTSMLLELALNGCTTIPTSENELRTAILKTVKILHENDVVHRIR
ncbi:16188_t:CDS:2 [Funneliformis geosporum]|nr:16188_t:CDS:2 [Funneliformis geosporum]